MASNPTDQPRSAPPTAHNALKHGFYSTSILLPGDDAEAYHRERLALFHTYRPQTVHEARLLNTMAEWQWQLERSSPLQARCDQQALEPSTDAAGRIGEPFNHQRLHSAMDVTVHRQRIDRGANRAHSKLIEVQRLRRLGLIEGAVRLPPGCYMECSGAIVGPVVTAPAAADGRARQETLPPASATAPTPAGDSWERGNGESLEQKENGGQPATAGRPNPGAVLPRAPIVSPRPRPIDTRGARRIVSDAPRGSQHEAEAALLSRPE